MSRLRFAVPARIAHPRWRVSQARLRWAAGLRHSDPTILDQECPAVKSLVSSVTQYNLPDLRQMGRQIAWAFLDPFRSLNLPNGTVWILAEPSNNSNLRAVRQLFGLFSGGA